MSTTHASVGSSMAHGANSMCPAFLRMRLTPPFAKGLRIGNFGQRRRAHGEADCAIVLATVSQKAAAHLITRAAAAACPQRAVPCRAH